MCVCVYVWQHFLATTHQMISLAGWRRSQSAASVVSAKSMDVLHKPALLQAVRGRCRVGGGNALAWWLCSDEVIIGGGCAVAWDVAVETSAAGCFNSALEICCAVFNVCKFNDYHSIIHAGYGSHNPTHMYLRGRSHCLICRRTLAGRQTACVPPHQTAS